IRPPRRAPYDLGALDDAYASAIGCACDVGDVTDLLPGSASKGATIGAAAGSIIPGVGTVVGGAVRAAPGTISDFLGGGKPRTSRTMRGRSTRAGFPSCSAPRLSRRRAEARGGGGRGGTRENAPAESGLGLGLVVVRDGIDQLLGGYRR